MDRKCNTEELSSTRIKTIVFQFLFVFKFCLPERLLTFMVSSHPATLLPCYPGCQRCFSCLLICFAWATKREAPSKNIYKQMPLGLQWCATALCALWFWYFYALKPSLLESSQIQMDMSSYLVKVRPLSLGKNKVWQQSSWFYVWQFWSWRRITVAQKGHTCKLKMLLQTKNFTCKLKIGHAN